MVTYVQIGKGSRMVINGTVKEIRDDFVKQMPKFKTLAPVYFYKSNKPTAEYIGILIPYTWRGNGGRIYTNFYWATPMEDWHVDSQDGSLSKIRHGTYGYDKYRDIVKMYKKKGYMSWGD